jgi:hypothetical protein
MDPMHLDGSKAGVSVQSQRHRIFTDGAGCEESSAEMGAAAAAAVWIRARILTGIITGATNGW